MIYFDSAYIARCYLPEPGHAEVSALAARSPRIGCAEIARIEVASVFHRKLREGTLTAPIHRELSLQFAADIGAGIWHLLPVTETLLIHAQTAYQSLPAPSSFALLIASTSAPPSRPGLRKSIPTSATSSPPRPTSACARSTSSRPPEPQVTPVMAPARHALGRSFHSRCGNRWLALESDRDDTTASHPKPGRTQGATLRRHFYTPECKRV
jgi:hypothetical protein